MYELGLLIALAMWLFGQALLIASLNSTFATNVQRLGMRISWSTLRPRPAERPDHTGLTIGKFFKWFLLAVAGLLWALTSWLAVVSFVGLVLYNISQAVGMPQALKEWKWRMKNQLLSQADLVTGTLQASGIGQEEIPSRAREMLADLNERGFH